VVSKSQIKLITSLAQKKYRQQHGLFVVEGLKGIEEFLGSSAILHSLYALPGYFETEKSRVEVNDRELKKMSFLKTPQKALAVFNIPEAGEESQQGLTLILDEVRDPGNLGTIIRYCDWYGIRNVICSNQTVDCYNPKVVQATMGSLTRVAIHYKDLENYLKMSQRPVYGAFMDGASVYGMSLPQDAILVLGNEANGISKEIEALIQHKIAIPRFSTNETESLNVAVAGAILVSEFKRNQSAT